MLGMKTRKTTISKSDEGENDELDLTNPEAVQAHIEKLEQANEGLATDLSKALDDKAELEATIAKGDEGDDDDGDDGDLDIDALLNDEDAVSKLDPETLSVLRKVADTNAEMAKRLTKAEEIAKGEQDVRLTREWVEKAEGMTAIPGVVAEEFGPVLKSVASQVDPATMEVLVEKLGAANAAIKESAITKEHGAAGGGDEDDDDLSKAVSKVMADEPGLSRAQAIAKAVEADPSLYKPSRTAR